MHPVFSSNIVFKHPVALIYHLFHIYFHLKCNLLSSHPSSTCFGCIRPSSGVFCHAKIVALYLAMCPV
jgi:hypothetical protein